MSFKWYGVDAGENGKGARVGEALAWVKEARSKLEDLEDGKLRDKMKGLSFGRNKEKSKEERKARKGRVEREGEDAEAWIRAYQKMNDTVRLTRKVYSWNAQRKGVDEIGCISASTSRQHAHPTRRSPNPQCQAVQAAPAQNGCSGRRTREHRRPRRVRGQGQLLLTYKFHYIARLAREPWPRHRDDMDTCMHYRYSPWNYFDLPS